MQGSQAALRRLTQGVSLIGGTLAAAVAAAIVYSEFLVDHDVPLTPALDAERETVATSGAGTLSYYVDRSRTGRPLVLIHSINAAGNALEMGPLFDHYRAYRPVYALELPGFGFSDRSDRVYSPALYRQAILDFLTVVVGEPADLVALSLGSEFAAAAALEAPELVHSLVLISPSGLRGGEIPLPGEGFYHFLTLPLWGQALFDLLTTRSSIRFFFGKNFVGDIPDRLVDYAFAVAHQPGARFAPLTFVSGQLFTADVWRTVYMRLMVPTLAVYDRDPNVSFERLPAVVAANEYWKPTRVAPSLGLPHWELPAETIAALNRFWTDLEPEEGE